MREEMARASRAVREEGYVEMTPDLNAAAYAMQRAIWAAIRERGWTFRSLQWQSRGFQVWYYRTVGGAPNSLWASDLDDALTKIRETP
jgi:hypothetical protein